MTTITTKRVRVEEIQRVESSGLIADAPPRLIWRGGKVQWQPTTIRATWYRERREDGTWREWALSSASVSGPKVKKNGEPYAGGDDHSERIYRLAMDEEREREWVGWLGSTKPAPGELTVRSHTTD